MKARLIHHQSEFFSQLCARTQQFRQQKENCYSERQNTPWLSSTSVGTSLYRGYFSLKFQILLVPGGHTQQENPPAHEAAETPANVLGEPPVGENGLPLSMLFPLYIM